MFNVSTEAELYREYGWQDLHEKSHGEVLCPGYRARHKLKSVPVPDNDKQTLV
jgi:hypothetical protein